MQTSLRCIGVVLMGKNTMMQKAVRGHLEQNAQLEKLLPHIKGNVGFVFTKGDLAEERDKLLVSKVRAPARAGAIAPLPVINPAQNPVYDSDFIFCSEILDFKAEDLRAKFQAGVANLAAVSLEMGIPPLLLLHTALAMVSRTCCPLLLPPKSNSRKPPPSKSSKFAAPAAGKTVAEKKEEKKEESEEEEDDDMSFGLFDYISKLQHILPNPSLGIFVKNITTCFSLLSYIQ